MLPSYLTWTIWKANSIVYQRMEEVLNDDKVFHEVLSRVNREHDILKRNAYKEQDQQEKERERLANRISKNHEAYEDGLISKEEFLTRKNELDMQMEQIWERAKETRLTLLEEERREIPGNAVRAILQNFSMALLNGIDHTARKRLLHLLIKEITIGRDRNIDSIKIKLSDELIKFLEDNGGTPPDGAPSVFMFREFGMKSLELELVL